MYKYYLEITKKDNVKQTHLKITIGLVSFVYFKYRKKLTIRFELSSGWN